MGEIKNSLASTPGPAATALVLRVHHDGLLVVSVGAGGERRLQHVRELLDFQLSGHEGAPHLGALEAVERLHVVGPANALLPHNVAARRLAPYHYVHLNTVLGFSDQNFGQCPVVLGERNPLYLCARRKEC